MPPSKTRMDKGYSFILSSGRRAAERGKGERRTRSMCSRRSSQAGQLQEIIHMAAENLEMDSLKLSVSTPPWKLYLQKMCLWIRAPGHGGVCRAPLMGAFLESSLRGPVLQSDCLTTNALCTRTAPFAAASCVQFCLQTGDAYTLSHGESFSLTQHDVCPAPSIGKQYNQIVS